MSSLVEARVKSFGEREDVRDWLAKVVSTLRKRTDVELWPLVFAIYEQADRHLRNKLLGHRTWGPLIRDALNGPRENPKKPPHYRRKLAAESLRKHWPGDDDFGVPHAYRASLQVEATIKNYNVLCNKIGKAGLRVQTLWTEEPRFLSTAIEEGTGTFSDAVLKSATAAFEAYLESGRRPSAPPRDSLSTNGESSLDEISMAQGRNDGQPDLTDDPITAAPVEAREAGFETPEDARETGRSPELGPHVSPPLPELDDGLLAGLNDDSAADEEEVGSSYANLDFGTPSFRPAKASQRPATPPRSVSLCGKLAGSSKPNPANTPRKRRAESPGPSARSVDGGAEAAPSPKRSKIDPVGAAVDLTADTSVPSPKTGDHEDIGARHVRSVLDKGWLTDTAITRVCEVLEDEHVQICHFHGRRHERDGQSAALRPNLQTLLIPIETDHHWTLLSFVAQDKKFYHSDSLHGSMSVAQKTFVHGVISDWLPARARRLEIEERPSQRQQNGHDCGVFVCLNAMLTVTESSETEQDPALWRQILCAMLQNLLSEEQQRGLPPPSPDVLPAAVQGKNIDHLDAYLRAITRAQSLLTALEKLRREHIDRITQARKARKAEWKRSQDAVFAEDPPVTGDLRAVASERLDLRDVEAGPLQTGLGAELQRQHRRLAVVQAGASWLAAHANHVRSRATIAVLPEMQATSEVLSRLTTELATLEASRRDVRAMGAAGIEVAERSRGSIQGTKERLNRVFDKFDRLRRMYGD